MATISSCKLRQTAPIPAILRQQTKSKRGFTLIELMIVVAIIGVLAAVALPVYQRYTIRAKISEAILALSSAKSSVTENYVAYGRMINSMTSMGIQNQQSKYVASISWASGSNNVGVVTATLTSNISYLGAAAGKTIDMVGTANGQVINWVCGPGQSNGVDSVFLPASCQN